MVIGLFYESGGTTLTASDDEMTQMVYYTSQREGVLIPLKAVATIAAYRDLLTTHFLEPVDETVLFFTGGELPDVGNYSL
jgi:threonine synthase